MKKVLFITNLPAPYKIDFFNELGKKVDLTVIFERKIAANRNAKWHCNAEKYKNFKAIWLHGINIGDENSLDIRIVGLLTKERYDAILINGYSSFSEIVAITYLRIHRKKYAIICDGILPGREPTLKGFIKRQLIAPADFWLSSNEVTDISLKKHGAMPEKIYRYPFSSIHSDEIAETPYKRKYYRSMVGCDSKYMILFVGQMIHRKGVDVLVEAVKNLDLDYKLFLIGSETGFGSDNNRVVNIGFLNGRELEKYYRAADVSILPSREDIWGLVINESLSQGTPVIATEQCGAALEMIENGQNGFIVPANQPDLLTKAIEKILEQKSPDGYMENAIKTARLYTIENMADAVYSAVQVNG